MGLTLAACDGPVDAARPQQTASAQVEGGGSRTSGQARDVIAAQQAALRSSQPAAFARTWAPGQAGARQRGRAVATNLRALGVRAIELRLAAAIGTEAHPGSAGSDVWTREVLVRWSLTAEASTLVTSRLRYTFVTEHGRLYVGAVTVRRGELAPPWLADRLHVRRNSAARVATATTAGDATRLHRLLTRAREDIPPLRREQNTVLLAYLPATARQFRSTLGATPGEYDDMAAVTTSLDGSPRPRAPMAVVVNPRIWPRLRAIGARVVVTHEAVHALTGPVTLDMPAWLVEGFADDVAIRAAGVPVKVAARQALATVRRQGPPARLPAERSFSGDRQNVERTYEFSRLVMRAIREVHGQRSLLSFYRHVAAGHGNVGAALREELETSRAALTRHWRYLLLRLASAR